MSEKDLKQSLSWAIEVLRVRNMNPLQQAYLDVIRKFNSGLSIQVVSLPEKEYELITQALATQHAKYVEAVKGLEVDAIAEYVGVSMRGEVALELTKKLALSAIEAVKNV